MIALNSIKLDEVLGCRADPFKDVAWRTEGMSGSTDILVQCLEVNDESDLAILLRDEEPG